MKTVFAIKPDFSYAYKMEGIPSNYHNLSFGNQIDYRRVISSFQEKALTVHIDTKGKTTMTSVKRWVEENDPLGFFASWKSDSSFHKDDNVIIYYIPKDRT